MNDFQAKIVSLMDQENFYEVVAEIAGEPEDDGESEWALLIRLDQLQIEKKRLLLNRLENI